jgi:hypothetical protein
MATHPSSAPAPNEEPLFAAPEAANDDAAAGRVWYSCGPPAQASIDATSEFLHSMWHAGRFSSEREDDLGALAIKGYRGRARDIHERIAHLMVHGEGSRNAARFTGRKGRSLGQPRIELDTIRMIPDLFVSPRHPDPEPYNEVLVLRHETASMTPKRFDLKSTAGILAITRHALERVHERSLLNGRDLHDTIRSQLWDVDYSLAFAMAAGLMLGASRRDRHAATAIPFCDGLLLVQNRIVALRADRNPSDWQQIDRSGSYYRTVAVNPQNMIELPPLGEFAMTGFIVPVAATFVAGPMLRHSQKIYRDFFLRHLDRCFEEMPDLPRQTMRCFEMHKVESEATAEPYFAVPDVGRHLLSEVLYQRTHETAMLSIGWTQFSHPRTW